MAEWFERWFGEEYLALYPHRDEADAAAAVELIARELGDAVSGRVLDLACGAGRHVPLLRRFGWTVGLDLSPVLLRAARANDRTSPYVRADMRVLPFAPDTFALVTNLFTSFGYFASDEEHARVMHGVHGVLQPGGVFILDYLNADYVRETLVPCDERELGGRTVVQRRSITADGRFVVKRITDTADGRTFEERVRLFAPDELRTLLRSAGFAVTAEFGEYSGASLDDTRPRAILFGARR